MDDLQISFNYWIENVCAFFFRPLFRGNSDVDQLGKIFE